MAEPAEAPEPELWCRGCRRVGSRALTGAECAWIGRVRRGHRLRFLNGLALVPLAFASFVGVFAVMGSPGGDFAMGAFVTLMMFVLLLGVPVAILLVRDHLNAWHDLDYDVDGASAWVFDPPADGSRLDEGNQPEATGASRAPFALLPRSRRIIDLDDGRPRLAREDVIEVEPRSGSGLYAPLSLGLFRPNPNVRFGQRALSGVECAELERVSRLLLWPKLGTALALVLLVALAWLVLVYGAAADPGWAERAGDTFSTAIAVVLCVFALIRYVRGIVLAGRIRQDVTLGLVVLAEEGREPGSEEGSGTSSPFVPGLRPSSEFLPCSRLLWRLGGAPAGWRNRSDAADRLRAHL